MNMLNYINTNIQLAQLMAYCKKRESRFISATPKSIIPRLRFIAIGFLTKITKGDEKKGL